MFTHLPHVNIKIIALTEVVDNHSSSYGPSFPRLLRQCLEQGHSRQEIAALNQAFDIAAELHGASFRRSKKTFQEHLVRTASILVAHGAPFDLVKAGLLHAVYMADLAPTEANRALLRELVGREVEAIVYAYAKTSPTGSRDQQDLSLVIEALPIVSTQVSVIRIANDIEDLLDHAALLEGTPLQHFGRVLACHGPVAEACGYEAMVAEFAERIQLAEAAHAGSRDPAAAAWVIELLQERRRYPMLQSRSQRVDSSGRAGRLRRKLHRIAMPLLLPVKAMARRILGPFGLA